MRAASSPPRTGQAQAAPFWVLTGRYLGEQAQLLPTCLLRIVSQTLISSHGSSLDSLQSATIPLSLRTLRGCRAGLLGCLKTGVPSVFQLAPQLCLHTCVGPAFLENERTREGPQPDPCPECVFGHVRRQNCFLDTCLKRKINHTNSRDWASVHMKD